jgi:prolyl-tRNA synthetase
VSRGIARRREAAEALYQQCLAAGIDTLLDDRAERAGVKFKDAELIGVPYRLTLGKKLAEGLVELSERSTRQSTDVRLEEAPAAVKQRLRS